MLSDYWFIGCFVCLLLSINNLSLLRSFMINHEWGRWKLCKHALSITISIIIFEASFGPLAVLFSNLKSFVRGFQITRFLLFSLLLRSPFPSFFRLESRLESRCNCTPLSSLREAMLWLSPTIGYIVCLPIKCNASAVSLFAQSFILMRCADDDEDEDSLNRKIVELLATIAYDVWARGWKML